MEELWKDRESFDAWCDKFAKDCKEEADDGGNNSGSERESDAELVRMGREVAATARRDPERSRAWRERAPRARWPGRAPAVAAALLMGACLAALAGPTAARKASGGTAGGKAASGRLASGVPQLRGSAEATVGAADAEILPARAARGAAPLEGVGSAAVSDVGESAKTLAREQTSASAEEVEPMPEEIVGSVTAGTPAGEQTSTGVEDVESMPEDIVGNVTAGGTTVGSWDKEPAAVYSVPKDSSVIAVASE